MIKIEITDDGTSKVEINCKDEKELFKNLERLYCELINYSFEDIKEYCEVARKALANSAAQYAFFQTREAVGYNELLTRLTDDCVLVKSEFCGQGKRTIFKRKK